MSDHPTPEELRQLEAALHKLRRIDRQVFLAHCIDQMTYADIARRTGLTVPQVERRMARAIYVLDRVLNGVPRPWRRRLQRLPWWPWWPF